jgi:hypothetical protein
MSQANSGILDLLVRQRGNHMRRKINLSRGIHTSVASIIAITVSPIAILAKSDARNDASGGAYVWT